MKPFACCLASLLLASTALAASSSESFDWPQWQGPDRDAISKEQGLLKEWPKEGPPLAWEVKDLGGGYGAPSVADGRIFGMSKREGKEVVWALSQADGKALWATTLDEAPSQGMPQGQEGPACTPTVDGERMYVITNAGELACLQVADGKVVWHRSMTEDFGGRIPTWSYRESPLVDGDKVVCTPGGTDSTLMALDKLTGKTIWKSQVPDAPARGPAGGRGGRRGGFKQSGASYASAIAIDFDGQRQYVQFLAKTLVGVAAADGKVLWRYDAPANGNAINCSTPLYHDGVVFAASAYGAGGGAAKLVKDADGNIKAEELWFSKKIQNHHGGVIYFDGCLYGANGGNEGGALVCLDFKTGNVLWNQRQENRAPKGSIALADGRFYYRCENGTMLLIEPSSKEYIEHGRFEQPDRSKSPDWAHPVIANGKLYLRDQNVLLCYDVKAK
jgi:outer membrane protein assembly factor BamB